MKCNATVKDVYDYINSIAPFDAQCDWDNSGLLVGSPDKQIEKIGVVLDITPEAIDFAAENGINLIVSHHPVIFKSTKNFLDGAPSFMLAQNGISAICAHTSLDIANSGVNDVLASALGFDNSVKLTENGELSIIRTAEISPVSGKELARLVAEKLSTGVRLADSGNIIKKIALCGGAGGDFVHGVAAAGCDAFITGEASHHEFLDALAENLTLIAAGHFETENPIVAVLANNLKAEFSCEVVIIPQSSPVKYF